MWGRTLLVTGEGLTITSQDGQVRSIKWDKIEKITVSKVDLYTFDDVRLHFWTGATGWEVSEEDAGWNVLVDALARHFPTIPSDWFPRVLARPFERNERILFTRT